MSNMHKLKLHMQLACGGSSLLTFYVLGLVKGTGHRLFLHVLGVLLVYIMEHYCHGLNQRKSTP